LLKSGEIELQQNWLASKSRW